MQMLRGRVQRMESLINGLLEYSHVGRTLGRTQRVDTAARLAEVIDWVTAPPDMLFEIQPGMPVFEADKIRLQQVFSNLLGNAVKHHGSPAGHIKVACESIGEFYKFSVTDDGPGIDPKYHELAFSEFSRLCCRAIAWKEPASGCRL